MTENPNQPRKDDAVLGGQNSLPLYAVVLGGIEGVKRRFANPNVEVRVAALKDALNYGEVGLDLVIQALQDESPQVQFTAYSLLKNRTEPKVKQQLDNFFPRFGFDVVTVDKFGQEISRIRREARYFPEDLGNGVFLEMVSIPDGTFQMGSSEYDSKNDIPYSTAFYNFEFRKEKPQHSVSVKPFYMGKYAVTQAQWKAVAALPQINLELNFDPSRFKGANRPVEQVSWHEVVEFCMRLSQKTGKTYRLPSEAEWEYACRAGTTTAFHFGETITTDLVNYRGDDTYTTYPYQPKGIYREQTTDVGSFPPNAFGLYDMHGNVGEWCADPWHENYDGAPSDGSVWEPGGDNIDRPVRAGCWSAYLHCCRSACRYGVSAGDSLLPTGFRVACSAAWAK